jgi:hypothetical protein
VTYFRVLSRTTLSYPSPDSGPNSRPLNLLQPLCRRQKSQTLWNQANPASFSKSPGVGYALATRPRGISNLQPLLSRPSCNLVNATLAEPLPIAPCLRCSWVSLTSFRINTCKSVTKQTTLTTRRINTYAKTGEGVGPRPVHRAKRFRAGAATARPSEDGRYVTRASLAAVASGRYVAAGFSLAPLPEKCSGG